MTVDPNILERLFAAIEERRRAKPSESYTASLLAAGPDRIAAKLREESEETIEAALADDPAALSAESADLLYHLLVLWAAQGITPTHVWAELGRREGISGHAEKAARSADPTESNESNGEGE